MTLAAPTLEYAAPPSLGLQLLRAAVAPKRGRAASVPRLEARVRQYPPADAQQLARYREVCGFEDDGYLPVTLPQVLATPLHLALLNHPGFPYRLLGMIHVRNVIRQHRRIPQEEALSVTCWVEGQREVRLGREVDLHTRVEVEGDVAWEAVTTMLRRLPGEERPKEERSTEDDPRFQTSRPALWNVPEDTGRRYARASGDYNPIHINALVARPFGFRRAIAHGMWTLGRCVAEMGEAAEASDLTLTCDFRRPLLLPAPVRFQTARDDAGVAFRVTSEEGKPHLVGHLTPGT
ncbi:MaoC/PaaZ C-terminal domain-containing protein [Myxococcaceae bacterium GXIMD 01537]